MKRYLTVALIVLSVIILTVGLRIDVYWNGLLSWGLTFICLIFATYFTKYIPEKKDNKAKHQ